MGNVKYFARIAGVLFVVCTITALLLGAVYGLTKGTIEENNIKTMNESISSIFEGEIEIEQIEGLNGLDDSVKAVYKVTEYDELIGYAVHVAPLGFKAEIDMIVGLDINGKCESVRVVTLSETPGLGSKVAEDDFLKQYAGKKETFTVKENITPIASATISSVAVTNGVNAAMSVYEIIEGGTN